MLTTGTFGTTLLKKRYLPLRNACYRDTHRWKDYYERSIPMRATYVKPIDIPGKESGIGEQ